VIDDWLDLLTELVAAEARFLVVGAHALAAHGIPRGTQDLDVWIEPSPENAARVWKALAGFGAPLASIAVTVADLERPDLVVQLGLPPSRIDIMTGISGIRDFSEAWARRIDGSVRGHSFPFLSRADLIANKRAAGRPKDLADLAALEGDETAG
jgi:hypothetical protein